MNNKLNKSDTAQQIRTRELLDTKYTDAWIEQQGINAKNFSSIHIKLLQAHSQANLWLAALRQRDQGIPSGKDSREQVHCKIADVLVTLLGSILRR
jgi:hypothetical protein